MAIRILNLFIGTSFLVGAGADVHTAHGVDTAGSLLLWVFAIPLGLLGAQSLRLAVTGAPAES